LQCDRDLKIGECHRLRHLNKDRTSIRRDKGRQAFWGGGIRQDWGEGVQGRVGCPDVSELRKHTTKNFEY